MFYCFASNSSSEKDGANDCKDIGEYPNNSLEECESVAYCFSLAADSAGVGLCAGIERPCSLGDYPFAEAVTASINKIALNINLSAILAV